MKLLLDSSVLIDVLRARNHRRAQLAELVRGGHVLCTTALNIAELYAGMRSGEEQATEALLAGLQLFEITADAGRRAGALKNAWSRKGRTLTLADTIIAAVSIERGCALVTDNAKDFPMPELHLHRLP